MTPDGVLERCRICGQEWVAGSRPECPHYRDAVHRRLRTNIRAQDVVPGSWAPAPALTVLPPPPLPRAHPVAALDGEYAQPIDFDRLAIVVSLWNNPAGIQTLVAALRTTTPTFRALYLIGNHPADVATAAALRDATGDGRMQFIRSGRTPEQEGRLAETWNLGFQWAFRDPEVAWVWCMHDDVMVEPGWLPIAWAHPADVYMAPFGDMCFLVSREAFQRVGWWDERFPGIGYQDNDWMLRAVWRLGAKRVIIESEFRHSGQALSWVSLNSVGLRNHWHPTRHFTDRQSKTVLAGRAWLLEKWAKSQSGTFLSWDAAVANGPDVLEVDWYPWFTHQHGVTV